MGGEVGTGWRSEGPGVVGSEGPGVVSSEGPGVVSSEGPGAVGEHWFEIAANGSCIISPLSIELPTCGQAVGFI